MIIDVTVAWITRLLPCVIDATAGKNALATRRRYAAEENTCHYTEHVRPAVHRLTRLSCPHLLYRYQRFSISFIFFY